MNELLHRSDCGFLRGIVRKQKVVPMGWNHQRWVPQHAHQPCGVVVDLFARSGCAYHRNVRLQPDEFTLEVVHSAEHEDSMAINPNQVSERASLGMYLSQRQRRFQIGWCGFRAEVVLVVQRTVQAGNYSNGECAHDVFRAFGTYNSRVLLQSDLWHVENVIVVRVGHQDVVCSPDASIDGAWIGSGNVIPTDFRAPVPRGCTSRASRWRWTIDPRHVRVDEYGHSPVADLPASCS